MNNSKFWQEFKEVDGMFKKAFIQMPGGQGGDPAAGGGMPPPGMDPSMMGGAPMDPSMMGGMPMDPSMMGGMPPMDPSMMGGAPMDPSMMGGMPPPGMDPMAMGMMPPPPAGAEDPTAAGGAPAAAPGSPMITISLDQLFEIIQKVLGLAKKVGANGSGLQAAPASEAPASGITQDQLKATIYEALGSIAG